MSKALDCVDVVVAGAGLAGLAAAFALRRFRVQMLEREPAAGGRVYSVSTRGARLDLGACFAYNPHLLPDKADTPGALHSEHGPIGVHIHGQLIRGDSALHALQQLPISTSSHTALSLFRAGKLGFSELPNEASDVARAFFRQIHPGDMAEYSSTRQADAWHDWYPDHWHDSNGSLVDAYASRLAQTICLNASVLRFHELEDKVRVEYELEGSVREVIGRALIIATPATSARELVTPIDPACAEFLRSVRYGRYTVVAFAFPARCAEASASYRYILTPQAKLACVMQQHHPQHDLRTLLCYYDDLGCRFTDTLDDRQLVDATARELRSLGFESVAFDGDNTWVKRWPLSGTILSDAYSARKRPEFARATRRVFLAGDYLAMTPGWGYGMDDAVASGRATGSLVNALLTREL